MIEYAGLNGRNQLVNDLADKFETQTASRVTFIHARCGQGKSYIVNHIIKKLEASEKIKVYCSCSDEIISPTDNALINSRRLNSLSATAGNPAFSFGLGIG